MQSRAGKKASAQAALPAGASQTADARSAVDQPPEEAKATAQADLIALLEKQPEPSPEIEQLAQRIRKAIRDRRPPDEDALMEAKPAEEAEKAGSTLNASVEGETKKVQDNYGPINTPPEGAPPAKGQELPPQPEAAATAGVNATAATPDPVPDQNVSLDADAEASRKKMQDAGMEKPTAQLVESGPIAEARSAQGELDQAAKEDPAKVLAGQKEKLAKAEEDMAALQAQAVAALTSSRASTTKKASSQQEAMVGSEESRRAKVSAEAQQIFNDTKKTVTSLLQPLASNAIQEWEAAKAIYVSQFKSDLAIVQRKVDERHSGVGGFFVGLWDAVTGLPDWAVEAYDKAEYNFSESVIAKIKEISAKVNGIIATCELLIKQARERIAKLFEDAKASLGEWAVQEAAKFDGQLDKLRDQAHATRDSFNKDLMERSAQAVDEVRTEIAELRKKAGGLIGRIANAISRFLDDPIKFIIEGLLELVGIPPASFWAVVAKIKKVIGEIADDPMKFANNLMAGLAQGFSQFLDNIGTHLFKGFISWLTGGLSEAGVELPKDLSLKSIITFFLQLMGITWPRIRKVLAKHIGEKNVALIEKVYSLVSFLIEKGPEGIFEMIKEKLNPQSIVDQVIQLAIDFLISAVIKAATARILLLFNPAGAILQALEAIYRVLKWIFQNAARIFTLIETVVNGIADILAGSIGAFANAVEKALAGLIAPVIAFIADYFGFGDLPQMIAEKIKSFQEWIMGFVEKALVFFIEKGKALLAAVGIGGKKEEKETKGSEDFDGQLGKTVAFTAAGERHRLWIDASGANATVMLASGAGSPLATELSSYRTQAAALPEKERGDVLGWIGEAEGLLTTTDKTADQLASTSTSDSADPQQIVNLDQDVESQEDTLASLVAKIREALGIDLADRFSKEFAQMHELARQYCLAKLETAPETVKGATSWGPVRSWLLENGLIFTQPLTRTTTYVQEVAQPQAATAATDAIEVASEQHGFSTDDLAAEKGDLTAIGDRIVDRSRSAVNAGDPPFGVAKGILQEFGFSERVRPYSTLRSAYSESKALANEVGIGERQPHHLITNKMVALLVVSQPQLNAQALRDDPRHIYLSSPGGHIGYERWHRHYDATMAAFIATFPPGQMTVDDLLIQIHNYYQSDHGFDVTRRIPGVSLI